MRCVVSIIGGETLKKESLMYIYLYLAVFSYRLWSFIVNSTGVQGKVKIPHVIFALILAHFVNLIKVYTVCRFLYFDSLSSGHILAGYYNLFCFMFYCSLKMSTDFSIQQSLLCGYSQCLVLNRACKS